MSMHMDDHAVKLLVARHREDNEARPDAYYCTKAPLGCGHYVRMDNPMSTGRCENCRRPLGRVGQAVRVSWWPDKYAALDESVWETLDAQAAEGAVAVGISPTWRRNEPRGPSSYQATIRVFADATMAGILAHVHRGVYVIVANAPGERGGCRIGCKGHRP